MELISRDPDLMRWLGAVTPATNEEHKEMRDRGDLVVRSMVPPSMFWQWQIYVPQKLK